MGATIPGDSTGICPKDAEYDHQVAASANAPRYTKPVQALTCYVGIKHVFVVHAVSGDDDGAQ